MSALPIQPAILLLLVLLGGLVVRESSDQSPPSTTISFSGYEWIVRNGPKGGPGPNFWSGDSVRLDKQGRLHLKIRRITVPATADQPSHNEWQCAEVFTKQKFGYGTYEFQVIGPIDRLDKNVVLGLFDYPHGEDGTDGTNEIDIEFARWGNAAWPNGNYTIYPDSGPRDKAASFTFSFRLPDASKAPLTTHRFHRSKEAVRLESRTGEGKPADALLSTWRYAAATPEAIPQKPLRVHLNLWLFQGQPPSDGKEIEIVLSRFTFTPLP